MEIKDFWRLMGNRGERERVRERGFIRLEGFGFGAC